eukprot:TRINITY_DN6502_c0_g1_i1.p1 TRINITY_DN6502_c0_g1~~TRINITY_DN6502_c0_g1_i1.p1  ORF type:complete len:209 (-),score=14.51 TRINITY_DN6502_c0_g1_i1:36-617(-)
MDHLACFTGGMFALGSRHTEDSTRSARHLKAGHDLAMFCHEMYRHNPSGLPSDSYSISPVRPKGGASGVEGGAPSGGDRHRLVVKHQPFEQRPEAVESWYYLYRLSGEEKYRDYAWQYYKALELHTKGAFGYSGLRDASGKPPYEKDDVQKSFFLAETLKYLFLIFSPSDVLPLDDFVFNTEAHPFHVYSPNA